MEMDGALDVIIYKAPSTHPAAQPERHITDNAEVSGSNPEGFSGKANVYTLGRD